MKNNILRIALFSALVAVIVVVVLKLLGHDNPTVTGGAVAGGVTGAIVSALWKIKK